MVINCHHHPLLTADQSLGMLDENLLGLCPLIPTWLLTVPAANTALGWLERETLMTNSWASQPANLACILQGWPPLAFLFLSSSYLHLWSTCSRGCHGCQKAWEDAGGKGSEAHRLMTVIHAAQLGDDRQPTEGSLQFREPRQRETLRGLCWEIYKTQGCLHLCSVLSILLTASCHGAPAYHHRMVK